MNYDFNKDLLDGKKGEVIAQEKLRDDFGKLEIVKGKCEFYDLIGRTTVEVKTDLLSKKTGNFALEYQKTDGKLTGISVSQAEFYFIICFDKEFISYKDFVYQKGWWVGYMIETGKLKDLAHNFEETKTIGGDKNSVRLILIPVDELRELSDGQYPVK